MSETTYPMNLGDLGEVEATIRYEYTRAQIQTQDCPASPSEVDITAVLLPLGLYGTNVELLARDLIDKKLLASMAEDILIEHEEADRGSREAAAEDYADARREDARVEAAR